MLIWVDENNMQQGEYDIIQILQIMFVTLCRDNLGRKDIWIPSVIVSHYFSPGTMRHNAELYFCFFLFCFLIKLIGWIHPEEAYYILFQAIQSLHFQLPWMCKERRDLNRCLGKKVEPLTQRPMTARVSRWSGKAKHLVEKSSWLVQCNYQDSPMSLWHNFFVIFDFKTLFDRYV